MLYLGYVVLNAHESAIVNREDKICKTFGTRKVASDWHMR